MTYEEERYIETWKSVIDVAKVVIGLSTSVLTVILGLTVIGQLKLERNVLITVGLLVVSEILALFSLGRAIKALSKGEKSTESICLFNLSVWTLIAGIGFFLFIGNKSEMSVDDVLSSVESSAKSLDLPIQAVHCQRIKLVGDDYEITYTNAEKTAKVIFSLKDKRIEEIN